MASIKDMMAGLRTIRANYARAAAGVNNNWRLSDAAKKEQIDGFRAAERAAVIDTARAIFGEAGAFWKERDALKAKLRAARDAADTVDPARLANTYKRVGSIVAGHSTVGELEAWYRDRATSIERRALQDTGAEAITERFQGAPETGGLLAALRRDREEALTTPEVRRLEGAIGTLEKDAYDAHGELWHHSGETGNPWEADQVLRAVRADMHFEDVTRLDAPVRYIVEKVPASEAGGYIPITEV